MAPFTLIRTCPAHPTTVWGVLTDFAAYESWIPLTTMRVDDGPPRVGWGFAGLSGIGPLRFSDSMVLTRWEPPTGDDEGGGGFAVLKTGRVLSGWADVRVTAAPVGSTVTWAEEITLRPRLLGRLARAATDRVSGPMFARALDAMLDEAVAREGEAAR
jgi:uncharacterized protein YndB with AHSA1/START domain